MREATAVRVRLRVCGSDEVRVAVAPGVRESDLPLRGARQRLEVDVLAARRRRGRAELLLLLCHKSAAVRRHSRAALLWNEASGKGKVKHRHPHSTHAHILDANERAKMEQIERRWTQIWKKSAQDHSVPRRSGCPPSLSASAHPQ